LDECLIHTCHKDENETSADIQSFICQFRGGQQRRVLLRPGCEQFLDTTLARYETHIFTAGHSDYAIPIIAELENRVGKRFAGCLFRDSCTEKKYMKMSFTSKDLRRLRRGEDMRRILLVDDDPTNFEHNPDNGIPVRAFRGDKTDKTLFVLSELIQELEAVEDVRTVLKERFKLRKIFDVSKEIFQPLHLQWENVYKCTQQAQL
jgi:RNA polymerase II subunit A small phosphatase-like protein